MVEWVETSCNFFVFSFFYAGGSMKRFFVRLLVEKIVEGTVYAENEKEARETAKSVKDFWDEETLTEKVLNVIELEG